MTDEQIAKMREAAMVASEFLEDLCVSSLDIVDLIDGYKALQQQNKTLLEAVTTISEIKYSALNYSPEDAHCMNDIATRAIESIAQKIAPVSAGAK